MTPPAVRTAPSPRSEFAERNIWFVGIGGCGVSGLALMLRALGATCRGSDRVRGPAAEAIAARGIEVTFDQSAGMLPEGCDLVIASAAVRPDHPEIRAARARGIEVLAYAEALGRAQAERTGVSIAGTHGKSTTAAMLCHVLLAAGLDPSFIIGANCPQIGGGSRTGGAQVPGGGPYAGRPGLLVAEACEFNRSFHRHRPHLAVVNNLEEDHLDVYGSLGHLVDAFAEFVALVAPAHEGGRLLVAHDGAHRREITAGARCAVETFGFSPAADYAVTADPARSSVEVRHGGAPVASWTSAMPGEHNALNGAAAAILATWLGAPGEAVSSALGSFAGVDRRMQRLGTRIVRDGPVVVYDDYGHHPTEVDATLRALRASERPRRLICVFQPHQHSRTRFLLDEFAQSFSSADVVIVPHIYFVRDSEIERHRVSAGDLVDRLRARGVAAMHLYPFEAIVEQLEVMCQGGDLLVIMGAGPVWEVARGFLDRGAQGPRR